MSGCGLIIGLFPLKNNLISLLEVFTRIDRQKSAQTLKIEVTLSLLLLVGLLWLVLLPLGMTMRLKNHTDVSLIEAIIFGLLTFVNFFSDLGL